jgi:hypothetical protein
MGTCLHRKSVHIFKGRDVLDFLFFMYCTIFYRLSWKAFYTYTSRLMFYLRFYLTMLITCVSDTVDQNNSRVGVNDTSSHRAVLSCEKFAFSEKFEIPLLKYSGGLLGETDS